MKRILPDLGKLQTQTSDCLPLNVSNVTGCELSHIQTPLYLINDLFKPTAESPTLSFAIISGYKWLYLSFLTFNKIINLKWLYLSFHL